MYTQNSKHPLITHNLYFILVVEIRILVKIVNKIFLNLVAISSTLFFDGLTKYS